MTDATQHTHTHTHVGDEGWGGGGTTRFPNSLSGTSEAIKTPLSGEHW